jgi:radical SAM superfamily enzyme
MTLTEIEIVCDTKLRVENCPNGGKMVDFKGLEIKEGCNYSTPWGSGDNVTEAKKDLAEQLKGKKVSVRNPRGQVRVFNFPPKITIR